MSRNAENAKPETGNRECKTGKSQGFPQLTGFSFLISGFLFYILFGEHLSTSLRRHAVDRRQLDLLGHDFDHVVHGPAQPVVVDADNEEIENTE